eukprot:scaffold1_cov375-Pavlova_lutheri.AAC.43
MLGSHLGVPLLLPSPRIWKGGGPPVTPRPRRVDMLKSAHVGPMCGSDGCTGPFGCPGSLDGPFSRPRPGMVDMVKVSSRKFRVPSRIALDTTPSSPLL